MITSQTIADINRQHKVAKRKRTFKGLNEAILCYSDVDAKTGKITHTIKTIYTYYRKDIDIDLQTFVDVCTEFNKLCCETMISDASEITCPIGTFSLRKFQTIVPDNFKGHKPKLRINFARGTKEKPAYHLNVHSNFFYFRCNWRRLTYIKNITYYYLDIGNYFKTLITQSANANTINCL